VEESPDSQPPPLVVKCEWRLASGIRTNAGKEREEFGAIRKYTDNGRLDRQNSDDGTAQQKQTARLLAHAFQKGDSSSHFLVPCAHHTITRAARIVGRAQSLELISRERNSFRHHTFQKY